MARPQKRGLDYFPLDTVLDITFDLIEAEFGLTGFAVIVKLLQKIYAEQGYYCEYTNEVALLFAKKLGLGGSVVSEIITASIKRGIFNAGLFDKYQILTSVGIQKRYFEAVSRRTITVEVKYLLISADLLSSSVNINSNNVCINSEIVDNNSTKEKKEKEKKLNKTMPTLISDIIQLYKSTCSKLVPVTELVHASHERAILNLWNVYSDLEIFKTVFTNANKSSFLAGENKCKWKASLDWLLKQDNFVKAYEGVYNYDDNDKSRKASYDIEELDEFWDTVPKYKEL